MISKRYPFKRKSALYRPCRTLAEGAISMDGDAFGENQERRKR
jgi:hypothetical protein